MSEWVIEVNDKTFTSGTIGDKKNTSCVVIGGAGASMTASYCRCNGTVDFKADEDGVWIKVTDLSVEQQGISNVKTDSSGNVVWGDDDWYFQGLYCKTSSFSMSVDTGSGNWTTGGASAITGATHISHDKTQSASSHNIWNDGVESKGWVKIANSINDLERSYSGSSVTVKVYMAGVVTFSQSVTDAGTADSVGISFTGMEVFFDYYPWSRRISGDFKSLNRDGTGQTSTGLFRRESGSWNQVINGEGDSGNKMGLRYNGGWNKCPKTGTGA